MQISEIRVKLVENSRERLKAFCSITLENDFVIRDLKVIDGTNGPFVAMPSRKLADRCPHCGHKNHLRARYCNDCGKTLGEHRSNRGGRRGKLHADIAHPINAACRERIQNLVVEAYQNELDKSQQPDYRPQYSEVDLDDFKGDYDEEGPGSEEAPVAAQTSPEGDNATGYDDLIAELKRDASSRREQRTQAPVGAESSDSAGSGGDEASSAAEAGSKEEPAADDFGAGIL